VRLCRVVTAPAGCRRPLFYMTRTVVVAAVWVVAGIALTSCVVSNSAEELLKFVCSTRAAVCLASSQVEIILSASFSRLSFEIIAVGVVYAEAANWCLNAVIQ